MPHNTFLQKHFNINLPIWTIICPIVSAFILLFKDSMSPSYLTDIILGIALIASVLSAVYHAEIIAHKVGEPYGTLILALAITIIEVSLIISLMLSERDTGPSALARDTVFAAIMIILTGIIGICLFIGGYRFKEQVFVKQGVNSALITLIAISVLTLVLPNYTTSGVGNQYSQAQLIFVAIVSLVLYLGFIGVQAIRHRDYFLPEEEKIQALDPHQIITEDHDANEIHCEPPTLLTTITSLLMLFLGLIAVVLLSKKLSPTIENIVVSLGAPKSLVGIIIATVILLPEGLAAIKAVQKNRLQTSLNLALGSALASIGLTIPAVAVVCVITGMTINLGIDAKSALLMIMALFIISISFNTNKTNIQQGIVLLVIFATYLFTTIVP